MKKILLISGIVCLVALTDLSAQDYKTGIGLRGSYTGGLTVKHFISSKAALEGILGTGLRYRGSWNITGLYEWESPISDVDGLAWFVGVGGHIGHWDDNPWWSTGGPRTVIGVDGIIGLEFTIPNAPICFQLDYKPAFNLIGYSGWWGDDLALSIRFAIK